MLLQALHEFYERAVRDELIDDPAFNPKAIRWIVPLDREGNLMGAGLIETVGKNNKGKIFHKTPRTSRPKVAGGVAEFLVDGISAVFGLELDLDVVEENERKRERQVANLQAKRNDFWEQIKTAHHKTGREDFAALLHFAENYSSLEQLSFLHWGVSKEAKASDKPGWWVTTASGAQQKLGADNFTFQLDGRLLLDEEEILSYWREVFVAETGAKDEVATKGLCLVTGSNNVPIMATHLPKISGVPGTTSTGALVVSFDKETFTSYGFDKSYNAPVSSVAVTAYTNALNYLLRHNNHRVRIADTALCFWARTSDEVTDMFAFLLETPKPETVRAFLTAPFKGIKNAATLRADDFYSVTLGGNAGRVVVRHWMQMSVEQATKNLQRWFADLQIISLKDEHSEKDMPLSLFRLASSTVRDAKDLPAETMTQLYRASLEGRAPSLTLAAKIVGRFKVDLAKTGDDALYSLSRFALLRLILNRHRKEGEPLIEAYLSDTLDAAYNCGRLLAIFDALQREAHEGQLEGAGVVERYYGTACAAPNSAFGILWRLHQHHLKKLSRRGDRGRAAAEAIKQRIADIAGRFRQQDARFPPQFPRTFNLQEQGRFALGFYQQKAADRQARQANYDAKKNAAANSATAQDEASEAALTHIANGDPSISVNHNEANTNPTDAQGESLNE